MTMDEAYWIKAQRAGSIVDRARINVEDAADTASERHGAKAKADHKRLTEIAGILQDLYDELLDMRGPIP